MEGKQDAPSAAASSITSIEGDQATSSSPSHSATLNSQTKRRGVDIDNDRNVDGDFIGDSDSDVGRAGVCGLAA
jgi:hypothetical protein